MNERQQAVRTTEELTVEKVVHGGHGLARLGGEVIFVEGAVLPGERVQVTLEARRAGVRWATLRRVLAPAPGRVEPDCPVTDRCGGCQLRHLEVSAQAAHKAGIVVETLRRARVTLPGEPEVVPAERADGWRCRVRYHGATDDAGRPRQDGQFGLSGRRSHEVVTFERCRQVDPRAEQVRRGVQGVLAASAEGRARRWSELRVELPGRAAAGARVTLAGGARSFTAGEGGEALLERLAAALPEVAGWSLQDEQGRTGAERGEQRLRLPLPPSPGLPAAWLALPGGHFYQADPLGNEALIRTVLELGGPRPGERVLELFCGSGNLTLPLAGAGAEVWAVEGDAAATRACQANAEAAGLTVRTSVADLRRGLPQAVVAAGPFGLVLLDPPRGGASGLLADLVAGTPPRLLYVSCDPPALGRDLQRLQGAGYRVSRWRVLDLFPQTYHTETVVALERG